MAAELLARNWPSDTLYILKVKLKVFADGLDALVSGRVQADSWLFGPRSWKLEPPQLTRERPTSCWWGLPGRAPDPSLFYIDLSPQLGST